MPRRKVVFKHQRQRSVLSDTLPYEVPISFSNRHFYSFLARYEVEFAEGRLQWVCDSDKLDTVICLIFGVPKGAAPQQEIVMLWGKERHRRYYPLDLCELRTIPFKFRVSHKQTEFRCLSVCHPRNQLAVSAFYTKFSQSIIYYAGLSPYSIRKPIAVTRFTYYKDRLHEERKSVEHQYVEEAGREYEQVGNYFKYYRYNNVHKFFESYLYHRAEKKYDRLLRLDISKCFDSIYTHSVNWAILGKKATKDALTLSKSTFGGQFDALMQAMNENETNGILIGPEFSRIFCELILQSVDRAIKQELEQKFHLRNKTDYEIFRYVDDYFVFFNSDDSKNVIVDCISAKLQEVKLNLNADKTAVYEKPIITEMTIAKDRISQLFNETLLGVSDAHSVSSPDGGVDLIKSYRIFVDSNSLIVRYKTIVKETSVAYKDIINYSFSVVENKIDRIVEEFFKADAAHRSNRQLVNALVAAIEFAFFVYAASPRVNHTIRICRILSALTKLFDRDDFGFELKHFAFKFVNDNIVQQLKKNRVTPYREIESLYLLVALAELGKDYWLEEPELAAYFGISAKMLAGQEERADFMSHFAITVCLSYMKRKVRYAGLRTFVEAHAVKKIGMQKAYCTEDAETLMLFLDLLVCPYMSDGGKSALADIFGFTAADVTAIQESNGNWFTSWEKFDFRKELDAKRSREVY